MRDQTMSSAETLEYIMGITGELSQLSRKENRSVLTYLLEMAHLEAQDEYLVERTEEQNTRAGGQ